MRYKHRIARNKEKKVSIVAYKLIIVRNKTRVVRSKVKVAIFFDSVESYFPFIYFAFVFLIFLSFRFYFILNLLHKGSKSPTLSPLHFILLQKSNQSKPNPMPPSTLRSQHPLPLGIRSCSPRVTQSNTLANSPL